MGNSKRSFATRKVFAYLLFWLALIFFLFFITFGTSVLISKRDSDYFNLYLSQYCTILFVNLLVLALTECFINVAGINETLNTLSQNTTEYNRRILYYYANNKVPQQQPTQQQTPQYQASNISANSSGINSTPLKYKSCYNCGLDNPANTIYCKRCGKKL